MMSLYIPKHSVSTYRLEQVLQCCRYSGLKLSPKKCHVCTKVKPKMWPLGDGISIILIQVLLRKCCERSFCESERLLH